VVVIRVVAAEVVMISAEEVVVVEMLAGRGNSVGKNKNTKQ
jgi:hypothetical protein